MDRKEIEDKIRYNISKDVFFKLYADKDLPIVCFYTKGANRIFLDENLLILESSYYQNTIRIDLRAIEKVVVFEYDKCDDKSIEGQY